MESFSYRAQDAAGHMVSGQLEARDSSQAARELLRQGLTPLDLKALDAPPEAVMPQAGRVPGRLTLADKVVMLRELSTLLAAGVSLDEALVSLASGHTGGAMGNVMARASRTVREGGSLHDALQASGLCLAEHLMTVVRIGEASGDLATALNDCAEQLDVSRRMGQELRNAMVYPTILVVAGLLAVLIIFIGVIPRFAPLLRGARRQMPEFSVWVIETAVYMKAHVLELGLGMGILAALLVTLLARPSFRRALLERAATAPVLGPWLRDAEVGRWALLMGTMLRNRVPLLDALKLSRGALQLREFSLLIASATRELEHGRTLYDSLRHSAWIPPTRLNLIKVGERAGSLDAMLTSLGSMQAEAARERQKRAMSLIEPIAILVIGAVIGMLMVAVMMAITSMNTGAA
ncbi:MAG: type II secretion system F family protein [Roseateles sp.]|uniref:type II secretion system F family protein n=1 Tax=Roseateles sp. TaxID=1971397 RepID=UPI004036857F